MQTQLTESYRQTEAGLRAETLLRACVHCGFCNATCPTYRLTGNELDGPRGRIYLMKQVFEGAPASAVTRQHLDRCLGCRGCETTCPSGVGYSELLDLGRAAVAAVAPRPWPGVRCCPSGCGRSCSHGSRCRCAWSSPGYGR